MSATATWFVILVSILMVGMGLCGFFSPNALRRFASFWQTRTGLWAAGLVRVIFGTALWAAAPSSRTPLALQVLAGATFVSGLALPLIGHTRFEKLIDWWLRRSPVLIRGWCLAATVLGVFVLWSISP